MKQEKRSDSLHKWLIASLLFHLLLLIIYYFLPREKDRSLSLFGNAKEQDSWVLFNSPATTPQTMPVTQQEDEEEKALLIPGQNATTFTNLAEEQTHQGSTSLQSEPQFIEKKEAAEPLEEVHEEATPPTPSDIPSEEAISSNVYIPKHQEPIEKTPPKRIPKPTINPLLKKTPAQKQQQAQEGVDNPFNPFLIQSNKQIELPTVFNQQAITPEHAIQDFNLDLATNLSEHGNNQHTYQNGNPNARITEKDLKMISYNKQFGTLLDHTLKAHKFYLEAGTELYFTVTLNRTGKLLHVQIDKGSGNHALDQLFLRAMQDTGLFPHTPAHITAEPYVKKCKLYTIR